MFIVLIPVLILFVISVILTVNGANVYEHGNLILLIIHDNGKFYTLLYG